MLFQIQLHFEKSNIPQILESTQAHYGDRGKEKTTVFFKGQAGKLMKYYAPHREEEDDHSLLQT